MSQNTEPTFSTLKFLLSSTVVFCRHLTLSNIFAVFSKEDITIRGHLKECDRVHETQCFRHFIHVFFPKEFVAHIYGDVDLL